jgi:hypothetical protein
MAKERIPAEEEAHDVLAAEAFAVPGPDPDLRHAPVQLPQDPTGIEEPHDVLAAEEFAMPAVHPHHAPPPAAPSLPRLPLAVGGLLLVALLVRALRRRS